jgi:hypothetical protein
MEIKTLSNASRSDVMEYENLHTLLRWCLLIHQQLMNNKQNCWISQKMGFNILWSISCLCTGHSGQTFTCNLCSKSFVTASTIFYKNTFSKGLDGWTMKWDTSKLTLLIFSHILLDFQTPKHLWLASECMASKCHLKLYSFGMFTLCSHIIYIMPPLYQIQKYTALEIFYFLLTTSASIFHFS